MSLVAATARDHAQPVVPRHAGRRLGDIDWDFAESRAESLHTVHPYPAKFIPDIPRTLIALLPPRAGTAVFDPFCGSGTTLVEAQRAGHASVGIDLNPVAVLISRVKTRELPLGIGKAISSVVEEALADPMSEVPPIPRLDHWFKPSVQVALARLGRAVAHADVDCRDILRLAMSSIIVRVSNQDSDTRYAAVEKKVDGADVYRLFVKSARAIEHALVSVPLASGSRPAVEVIESDVLQVNVARLPYPVGLVVTSPPYPNAYEYWLYHKYRMWWLGFDPLAVKDLEIGARAHFFGGKRHTVSDFTVQMNSVSSLLREAVVPGGHVCFIVGRSKIHGEIVDNAELIGEALSTNGFDPLFKGNRTILSNRKSFNLSHANIKSEAVIVFRKKP